MMLAEWGRRLGILGHPVLPTGEAYALWAETYPARPHNPLMEVEQAVVAPIITALRPVRALDVGTGTGRCLHLLAGAGARLIVGVDCSLPMLRRRDAGAPVLCGDACRLPFGDGQFDLVCSSLMAGDLADLGTWISEASRVLQPGKHLVYSDFHPSWASKRWRRTFRAADGRTYELAYAPHSIDEHLARIAEAGLKMQVIREPRIAGRGEPVVVVFQAVKTPDGRTSDVGPSPLPT
jgi:SAM-dependent methyltransferase